MKVTLIDKVGCKIHGDFTEKEIKNAIEKGWKVIEDDN